MRQRRREEYLQMREAPVSPAERVADAVIRHAHESRAGHGLGAVPLCTTRRLGELKQPEALLGWPLCRR